MENRFLQVFCAVLFPLTRFVPWHPVLVYISSNQEKQGGGAREGTLEWQVLSPCYILGFESVALMIFLEICTEF